MSTTDKNSAEEAARRQGYVEGRQDESFVQAQRPVVTTDSSSGSAAGLILGLLIAGLAIGIAAFAFLGNGREQPVSVPDVNNTVTDIELPDVDVEVPDVQAPDVDVEVPEVGGGEAAPSGDAE